MSSGADNPANDPRVAPIADSLCHDPRERVQIEVMVRYMLQTADAHDPLRRALDAVRDLAEDWKYKGEFGFGAWQEGQGPDEEGYYLDKCATQLLAALDVVGTPAPAEKPKCVECGHDEHARGCFSIPSYDVDGEWHCPCRSFSGPAPTEPTP